MLRYEKPEHHLLFTYCCFFCNIVGFCYYNLSFAVCLLLFAVSCMLFTLCKLLFRTSWYSKKGKRISGTATVRNHIISNILLESLSTIHYFFLLLFATCCLFFAFCCIKVSYNHTNYMLTVCENMHGPESYTELSCGNWPLVYFFNQKEGIFGHNINFNHFF